MKQEFDDTLDEFIIKECESLVIPMETFATDVGKAYYHHDDEKRLTLEINRNGATIMGDYSPPNLTSIAMSYYGGERERLEKLISILKTAVSGTFSAICYWNVSRPLTDIGVERVTVQDGEAVWEDITP